MLPPASPARTPAAIFAVSRPLAVLSLGTISCLLIFVIEKWAFPTESVSAAVDLAVGKQPCNDQGVEGTFKCSKGCKVSVSTTIPLEQPFHRTDADG